MRTFRARPLISVALLAAIASVVVAQPVFAQATTVLPPTNIPLAVGDVAGSVTVAAAVEEPANAVDAALNMANILDGAGGGISSAALVSALQDAAAAGQPMALWQLGLMYESGEGVQKDAGKAFAYFSQIADEHADAAPRGVESDIVAQSFVKVGEYYREGLPEAGIAKDEEYGNRLVMHAASYFGDADAQYRVGKLYLDDKELGDNPLQSARWLSLAARKGHAGAQAQLGDMLFNGQGIEANQIEGLMWLTVAGRRSAGTPDEAWITQKLNSAMSVATPEQRKQATDLADSLGTRFGGL